MHGSDKSEINFRTARVEDGARLLQLVRDTDVLEPNSGYAYLLLCTHFADTVLLAERGDALVGFVAAYRPPKHPGTVFVWQIGVLADARGEGLGLRLLHRLVQLPGCRDVTHLEATVAASNTVSSRLFQSFARSMNAACEISEGFRADHFGTSIHEAEDLYRIGPLRRVQE